MRVPRQTPSVDRPVNSVIRSAGEGSVVASGVLDVLGKVAGGVLNILSPI